MHTFQPEKQSWSSLWSSMASWIDDCCVSISMVCTLVVDTIGLYCLNVAACYNTLHKHWFYAGSYRQWLCCFSLVYWKDIPTWLAVPTSAVAGVFLSMETYYHLQMPHQQTVWVRPIHECMCMKWIVVQSCLSCIDNGDCMQATSHYVYDVNILLVSNGVVLGTHHLVVFILLVVIYSKLLRYIKKIRCEFRKLNNVSVYCIANIIKLLEQSLPHSSSCDPGMLLITGQSRAKRRILAFLTVFLMTGVISEITE